MTNFIYNINKLYGDNPPKYISNLDFINQEIWQIYSHNLPEIDLLNPKLEYLQEELLEPDQTLLEKLDIMYFGSKMLDITNIKNNINIDVSSWGDSSKYSIRVTKSDEEQETIFEHIIVYRFNDCKRFLIEFMVKYENTIK